MGEREDILVEKLAVWVYPQWLDRALTWQQSSIHVIACINLDHKPQTLTTRMLLPCKASTHKKWKVQNMSELPSKLSSYQTSCARLTLSDTHPNHPEGTAHPLRVLKPTWKFQGDEKHAALPLPIHKQFENLSFVTDLNFSQSVLHIGSSTRNHYRRWSHLTKRPSPRALFYGAWIFEKKVAGSRKKSTRWGTTLTQSLQCPPPPHPPVPSQGESP